MSQKTEQLTAFLNKHKPDYKLGLTLLLCYTDKPQLLKQLTEYPDLVMLKKVLSSLLQEGNKKEAVKAVVMERVVVEEQRNAAPDGVVPSAPRNKVEQQLHLEWIDYLKQVEDLKQKLFFIGRDATTGIANSKLSDDEKAQRRQIAKLLVGKGGLNEKCMENRDALRYYRDFGKLPVRNESVKKELPSSGDSYRDKENTRKQIAKLKGKILNNPTHKLIPVWNQKLLEAEGKMSLYAK